MSNTLITPSVVAREALMRLYANAVTANLVHRDFSTEFVAKVGDTVTVRKPATFTAQEFVTTTTTQDATESSVAVKLDHHLDVTFAVTSKELSLELVDFSNQLIAPAVEAIAQKIDQLLLGLYVDVPYESGTAGTTPSAVADITQARKILGDNFAPLTQRSAVIGTAAEDKFLQLATFHQAEHVGDNGTALREASIGRKFGLDFFVDQNLPSHSNGTIAHTGTFAVNGAVLAGAAVISIDATTITGTIKEGTIITIAGLPYTVTADLAAAGNALTNLGIDPPAPVGGIADNAVVTRIANHVPNLLFHHDAFALVTRPLALPMGVAGNMAAITNYKGFGLRTVFSYNATTKTDQVSIDVLCGVKTLNPALAVRMLG